MINMPYLLNRKMTRKQFLVSLGGIFLTIFGISSLLKNLKEVGIEKQEIKRKFGSGQYGI